MALLKFSNCHICISIDLLYLDQQPLTYKYVNGCYPVLLSKPNFDYHFRLQPCAAQL